MDGSFTKMLSDFIFVFLLPCLVLDSMRFDFSLEVLINSGLLALVACGVLIVLWGMGFLISKRLGKTFDVQAVIEFSITCSNFTFMGLPVIASRTEFKRMAAVIVANRTESALDDVPEKVYTRDLYRRD